MFTESPRDSKHLCQAPGTQHIRVGATLILKESTGGGGGGGGRGGCREEAGEAVVGHV